MNDISDEQFEKFVMACHRAAALDLIRCSSGNLSWRVDDKHMLVTSSRTWMADISQDQVAVCRISDGAALNNRSPTVEIGFHSGILRERADVNVVMHFQTPFATTLACRNLDKINFFVIPEIPYYIGAVAEVPYLAPGSKDLAEAVTSVMRNHDLVVMRNHGQVTVGKDFSHAIQNASFFELACEIILLADDQVQCLSEEAVRRLRSSPD